jgi:hypothetical protein
MPVKLGVAIDRVQLFDTLNLSSQRDDLLTEKLHLRKAEYPVPGVFGRKRELRSSPWILGLGDIGVNQTWRAA